MSGAAARGRGSVEPDAQRESLAIAADDHLRRASRGDALAEQAAEVLRGLDRGAVALSNQVALADAGAGERLLRTYGTDADAFFGVGGLDADVPGLEEADGAEIHLGSVGDLVIAL